MKGFYILAWITAPGYYFTIVLYRKNRCEIGNNTIIWNFLFAMGTKIVLKLFFEKLFIMIVTDVYAFVNAWVVTLEYHFLCEKLAKYHILFNKFQFIDQAAIKKLITVFFDKPSHWVKQLP